MAKGFTFTQSTTWTDQGRPMTRYIIDGFQQKNFHLSSRRALQGQTRWDDLGVIDDQQVARLEIVHEISNMTMFNPSTASIYK
jgi:hypothetical protein